MENKNETAAAVKARKQRNGKRKILRLILSKSESTQLFIYNELRDIFEKRKQGKLELEKAAKKLGLKIKNLQVE